MRPSGRALPPLARAYLFIARDSRDDAVPVHRGAGVLRGDEEILLARLVLLREEGVAGLMHVQYSRDQIGFRRQDVTILADAGDLSGPLQLPKRLVQIHPHAAFPPERFRELDLVERSVFRARKGCAGSPALIGRSWKSQGSIRGAATLLSPGSALVAGVAGRKECRRSFRRLNRINDVL